MSPESGLWLIGVTAKDLTASGAPDFLQRLQSRFRGRENVRDGVSAVVRQVTRANDIATLQRQHGAEYKAFYYLGEALAKAAENSRIKLRRLQLVFGDPAAEVVAVIYLPNRL